MVSKLYSCALVGLEAHLIEIEVDAHPGMPFLQIVGLPDTIIRESRERIWSALKYSGFSIPNRRITINLAPASLKKEGALLDLPISIAILMASNQVNLQNTDSFLIAGELALDGGIRTITGSLSMAINAKRFGKSKLIIPEANKAEAAMIDSIDVFPVKNLTACIDLLLKPENSLPFTQEKPVNTQKSVLDVDFQDVKGQRFSKRGVEIACAGGHHLLMVGPPGSGKTMLAKRLPTILPPLNMEEILETTQVYSIANLLNAEKQLIVERPFRAPHHTASDVAIVGGGSSPKPGEISLAHHGILFLDELPEFKTNVLQVLRQPLEEGTVTISRSERTVTYPSRFMLVGAMNPCECGYFGHPDIPCKCSPRKIQRYIGKISGPVLDRIDIQIEVPKINYKDMLENSKEESSQHIYQRVERARKIQAERYKGKGFSCNAQIDRAALEKFCTISDSSKKILQMAMEKLFFSARSFDKILKISRTIADLEQRERIEDTDIMEALQYRGLDRMLFH